MYPGISDLLNDLLGTSFNAHFPPTFGTLVAISFFLAAWTLRKELVRKERAGLLKPESIRITKGLPASAGDIFGNALFGFIIGAKAGFAIFHSEQFFSNPQSALLSLQGDFISGLVAAGILGYLRYRESERQRLKEPVQENISVYPSERVGDLTMMAAVGGLLGAKFFHHLEYWDDFIADPIGSFFSGSGLTMYGGLIVGACTVLYYARKKGIDLIQLCDATAPGLMLAYGVGRLGCQLAGDGDWGVINTAAPTGLFRVLPDWCWSFTYPHNVINEGIPIAGCDGKYCYELAQGVYPTPLYEATACILLFFLLWSVRKRISIPGQVFSLYLLLNGVERFLIELIRVNSLYHVGTFSFTQAQLISFLLILTGITGWFWSRNRSFT